MRRSILGMAISSLATASVLFVGQSALALPSSSDETVTIAQVPSSGIVRDAFGGIAQVELLRVYRLPARPDVVNVQVRVRLVQPERIQGPETLAMLLTTAQDPDTGISYEPLPDEYTSGILLPIMDAQQQSSVDAHALLPIPQGVDRIDLYIDDTAPFMNVPIE